MNEGKSKSHGDLYRFIWSSDVKVLDLEMFIYASLKRLVKMKHFK